MNSFIFVLTTALLLGANLFSNAQEIEIKNVFLGHRYMQDGNILFMDDLKLKSSDFKYPSLLRKSRTYKKIGSIMLLPVGVFTLIGVKFINNYNECNNNSGMVPYEESNSGLGAAIAFVSFVAGASFLGISIPFWVAQGKRKKQAVELYNSKLSQAAPNTSKISFNLVAGNGIGNYYDFLKS